MVPWLKRAKRLRTVSAAGKRAMPSMVWRALSKRSRSACAKRLAPATTEITKAINVWAGGMAFGEWRVNGIVCASLGARPILLKNSRRQTSPPNGVTALGVERIWTGFEPKTGRKKEGIVLCGG